MKQSRTKTDFSAKKLGLDKASVSTSDGDNDLTAFSFGDPETVLSGDGIANSLGIFLHGQHDYYEPAYDQKGLAKLLKANPHHGTIPFFKANLLRKWYVENEFLPAEELHAASMDFDVLGHCYFKKIYARYDKSRVLRLEHLPGVPMRRMREKDRFCKLVDGKEPLKFKKGEVVMLKKYDLMQQIYGCPEYIGAINSILLNEDATLFRRKYYTNGAHMGYIFYTANANFEEKDELALKKQIKESKGVGNFKSMFLNIPGGDKDTVQIIPIGDISTKDEMAKIKDITRDDILAAWRVRAELAGMMPVVVGGTGDLDKISRMNYENEVVPVQLVMLQLNKVLAPDRQIKFDQPEFDNIAA